MDHGTNGRLADPRARAAAADAAEAIAREAGALIRERFDRPRSIGTKSAPVDLVTDTDRAADELIRTRLAAVFPGDGLVTEEGDVAGGAGAGAVHWVVDPLDGTTNFAHGFPQVAVSIAAVAGLDPRDPLHPDSLRRGRVLVGIVHDPIRDELYRATIDEPSTCNGRPVAVSAENEPERCLVSTGFPYDRRERIDEYLRYWRAMMLRCRDLRRAGAAALDLAWVACGRIDAFWEWRLHPWDVAAGTLVVRRAGGRTSDFAGSDPGIDARQTLASNGRVHTALGRVLCAVEDGERRAAARTSPGPGGER